MECGLGEERDRGGRGVGASFKVINELEFLGAAKTSNFCLVALELKLGSCF